MKHNPTKRIREAVKAHLDYNRATQRLTKAMKTLTDSEFTAYQTEYNSKRKENPHNGKPVRL